MAQTTYRKLAELIRDTYYKGKASDDASHSLRYFAELIAMEVAEQATQDAFANSNNGDTTYVNDQFITSYSNLSVQLDDVQHKRYVVLPATPTALPNNQEIVSVRPVFAFYSKRQFYPLRAKDEGVQDLLDPVPFEMYQVENGRVYFYNVAKFNFTAVNVKLAGAIPSGELLDAVLNIPKNVELRILDKVLARLLPAKMIPEDTINDNVSNPA